jgi:hypothetical protein
MPSVTGHRPSLLDRLGVGEPQRQERSFMVAPLDPKLDRDFAERRAPQALRPRRQYGGLVPENIFMTSPPHEVDDRGSTRSTAKDRIGSRCRWTFPKGKASINKDQRAIAKIEVVNKRQQEELGNR